MNILILYSAIRKLAKANIGKDDKLKLEEACDFGDSFGFIFESGDKYSNVYWCVSKKTAKPFLYRPNQDIKKFIGRKIITDRIVGVK